MRVYQQPAGFKDSIITGWKIEEQAKTAPVSISLRDMFAGGLSESALSTCAAYNQIPTFIRGKMTAAVQVTDTDVAFRVKAKVRRRQQALRKELQALASMEGTRAVFKCGAYEVLRVLAEAIEDIKKDFAEDDTLKKAVVRNGWCNLRPKMSKGTFVKATEEAWAKDLVVGTHRLRSSWVAKRYENLDEKGLPKTVEPLKEEDKEEQGQASYHDNPGDVSVLESWKAMVEAGEMTPAAVRDIQKQPWLAFEVNEVEGLEGLGEARELLKTPQEMRRERGLDRFLTSQKPDKSKCQKRKMKMGEKFKARVEARKRMLKGMRALQLEGYSTAQAASMSIVSKVGSKKVKRAKVLKHALRPRGCWQPLLTKKRRRGLRRTRRPRRRKMRRRERRRGSSLRRRRHGRMRT